MRCRGAALGRGRRPGRGRRVDGGLLDGCGDGQQVGGHHALLVIGLTIGGFGLTIGGFGLEVVGRGEPPGAPAAGGGAVGNTHDRNRQKRTAVASPPAPTRTATSAPRPAWGARWRRPNRALLVSTRPTPKMARPCSWCRTCAPAPRTPKVMWRLAAVLRIAVDQQGEGVGGQRRDPLSQHDVEQHIGERADDADHRETHQLGDEAGAPRRVRAARSGGDGRAVGRGGHREPSSRQHAGQAGHALQVGDGRRPDVDARVGVVDPVDGHLVDAHAGAFGEEQQLRVEEPSGVLDEREQRPGPVGTDRLEAALGVGEPGRQGGVQQGVVAARDDLALGAAHHAGARGQARPDRHVAVPRHERGHEGQQRGEVRAEINVHVGEDRGVARGPHVVQGPAAALGVEVHGAHPGKAALEGAGDVPGAVGAGVVGDGDPEGEGKLRAQIGVQASHARFEFAFLVVDGDHDLDLGPRSGGRGRGAVGCRIRENRHRAGPVGDGREACPAAGAGDVGHARQCREQGRGPAQSHLCACCQSGGRLEPGEALRRPCPPGSSPSGDCGWWRVP